MVSTVSPSTTPGSHAACWASEPNSAMVNEAISVDSSGTEATDRPWRSSSRQASR